MKNDNRKKRHKLKIFQNIFKITIIIALSVLGLIYVLKDNPINTFQVLFSAKFIPILVIIIAVFSLLFIDAAAITFLAKRYNRRYTFFEGMMNTQIGDFIGTVNKTSAKFIQAYTFTKQEIKGANAASIISMNYLVYQFVFVIVSILFVIFGFPFVKDVSLDILGNMRMFYLSLIGLAISVLILLAIIFFSFCKPLHRLLVSLMVKLSSLFKLGDEDELYKKWTMTFVTYRLEIIKLWHHKSILLFLLLTNIAKQCLTNIIPFLCMWAMNLPVNKDIFKAVFFSSSYLQLISSYIPAGGAEVAYQNLYTFVFSSSYLPSIAASNLLWRVFTFYFHLLFGGLCFLFYKGSPKRDELLSNTATIFDLQVINFSQSADDKTKEFSLGIIDKNHKHSKKELLSKEDVERSFLKIKKSMNVYEIEKQITPDMEQLGKQKEVLANVIKETEKLILEDNKKKQQLDSLASEEINRREEKKRIREEKKSNKDKKLLENMLFEGSKIDVDENGIKIHGPEVYQKKTLLSEDPDEKEEDR
ncbi:MAG: lysylphosphatidylglycerol synthase domain-containing protein [Candidatus Enterosoma sp.]|nr:lysylphosphatidylglycerol synthase domain-containing protein [Candidatus Enterosoma sp.]